MRGTKDADTLTSRVRTAALWSFLLISGRSLAGFLFNLVLARILGPGPFGVVAIALVFVGVGLLLVDAGAGSAIVQADELYEEYLRSAFTLQVLIGTAVSTVVWLAAPLVEVFFHMQDLSVVLRWLSPLYLIQAFSIVSTSLLKRELQQRRVNTVMLTSYVLAFGGFAVPLALRGAGVWSLVVGQLVQASLMTSCVLVMRPHSWIPRSPFREPEMLRYGRRVLEVNMLNIVLENADTVVVGRRLSAVDTGLYSRAYITARLGVDGVLMALQSVLLSGFSRRQDDDSATRRGYLATLNLLSLILMPAIALLAVLAEPISQLLYGPKWVAMAPAMSVLALGMYFHTGTAVSGPLLWARDRVRSETRAAAVALTVLLAGLLIWAHSLVAAAVAVMLSYGVRAVFMLAGTSQIAGIGLRPIARSWLAGWRVALIAAAPAAISEHYVSGLGAIALSVAVAVPAWFLILRLGRATEWSDDLRALSPRLGPLRFVSPHA